MPDITLSDKEEIKMAERPGFEPGVESPPQLLSRQLPSAARPPLRCRLQFGVRRKPYTAVTRFTPNSELRTLNFFLNMAEREGFEPPELSLNGFQDRRLKPLGHLSGVV
jgi:hypothetical protein